MRKILTVILAILAVALGLRSYVLGVGNISVPATSVTVHTGDTLYGLPERLGLQISDWRWKAFVRMEYSDYALGVGTYAVRAESTVRTVLDTVLSAPPSSDDASITILPGWNVYDIDAAFVRAGLASAGDIASPSAELMSALRAKYSFLVGDSLEGYLYPDTYRLDPKSSLSAMLSRMLDAFESKIAEPAELSSAKLYDTMKLASIVEREERDPANKPIVAGILAKRLDE